MPRQRGPLGGLYSGALLDELVVRISVDLSGFRRGIAEAISEVRGLKAAIAGGVGGASLGDVMTAALVAPMAVATARIGQVRNEMRLLGQEMRNVAAISYGGAAALGASRGAIVPYAAGGALTLNAARTRPTRGAGGRFVRSYSFEDADLSGGNPALAGLGAGAGGISAGEAALAGAAAGGAGRRRRGWFERTFSPSHAQRRFGVGRREFPGFGDAADEIGVGANRVGQAGRRAAGGRLAAMLGLTGVGAMFGDLIRLAGALATVIAGTLAGAFAALVTPIGLVVAGLTALAALFVAANWDSFREFGEWFGARARTLLGEGLGDIVSGWRNLTGAFQELWGVIAEAMGDDSGSIAASLRFFGELALQIINRVMELLAGFLNTLAELVRAVSALLRGDWADAWSHFGTAIQTAFDAVLGDLNQLFPELQAKINEIADWVTHRFSDMGAAISNFFGGAANDNGRIGGSRGDGTVRGGAMGDRLGGGKVFRTRLAGAPLTGAMRGKMDPPGDLSRFAGIENAVSAMGQLREAAYEAGHSVAATLTAMAVHGARASDVLSAALSRLANRLLDMGTNALGDGLGALFSGALSKGKSGKSSGIMSAIGGAVRSLFGGGFADGGYLAPGKWGIVGERGPEIAFGGRSGMSVHPNGGAGGFNYVDNRRFDMRGASVEAVARLEAALANDRAAFGAKVLGVMGDTRRRGRY